MFPLSYAAGADFRRRVGVLERKNVKMGGVKIERGFWKKIMIGKDFRGLGKSNCFVEETVVIYFRYHFSHNSKILEMEKNSPFKPELFKKSILVVWLMILNFTGQAQNPVVKNFEDWSTTTGTQNSFQRSVVRSKGMSGTTYNYLAGATLNGNGDYDMMVSKYTSGGVLLWTRTYNGVGNGDDIAADVQVDAVGNVYICGSYYKNPTDSNNAIIIKYNAAGTLKWTYTYNGPGSRHDAVLTMATANNAILVCGLTWVNSTNKYDMLAIRVDSSGNQVWTRTYDYLNLNDAAHNMYLNAGALFVAGGVQSGTTTYKYAVLKLSPATGVISTTAVAGGTGFGIDQVADIQSDNTGNIFITGSVFNATTLYDFRTIKLDTALNIVWSASYDGGNNLNDFGAGIKVDAHNNVIVTGSSRTTSNGNDFTTIKYNSSGTQLWVRNFDGGINADDSASAIVINDTNHIYVTGYSFNGSTNDYYTIRYDASGNLIYGMGFNSIHNADDRASAIALDTLGNVVVTGQNTINDTTRTYTTVKYFEKNTLMPQDTITTTSSSFVYTENRGQLQDTNGDSIPEIKYYVIKGGPQVYFSDTAISYVLAKLDTSFSHNDTLVRVDMKYKNANTDVKIRSMGLRKEYENFYLGHIPDGRCHVQNYDNLVSFNVWNNVDVIYGSNLKGMKYYFICKPGGGGGSYASIDLQYSGADSVKIDGTGQLIVYTPIGTIVQPKAAAWQIDGSGNFLPLGWQPTYNIVAPGEVKFNGIGVYNSSYALVFAIDWGNGSPGVLSTDNLLWSTFEGGSNDDKFEAVSVSTTNWLFAGGTSYSTNFPFAASGYQTTNAGSMDGVVQQYHIGVPSWSTYLGGTSYDYIYSVCAIGSSNSVYLAGKTSSSNFPTAGLAGSFTSYSGGGSDAIVAKLNGGGGLVWSTCYGGSTGNEIGFCVKATSQNAPFYVLGHNADGNTPLTTEPGASNLTQGSAFIIKFDQTSFQRIWATRFGGTATSTSARSMRLTGDPSNFLVITGEVTGNGLPSATNSYGGGTDDAYVAAFNSSDQLNWSTYYGGSDYEISYGIAVNSFGDILITGGTNGNSPTPNPGGAYQITSYGGNGDAFVASLNSSGTITWATYLGGSLDEFALDMCIDQYDNFYIVGSTRSTNFLMPAVNPVNFYTHSVMSSYDGFIFEFDRYYNPVWGTYFGGQGWDEIQSACVYASAQNSYLYTTGFTYSSHGAPINPFPILRASSGDFSNAYQNTLVNGSSSNFPTYCDGFVNAFDLTGNPNGIPHTDDNTNEINIYPNPTNGSIFLDIQLENSEDFNIIIYDILGQVIYQKTERRVSGKYHSILDLSLATNGIYIAKVQFNDHIATQKIILDN
jgi:hypothetical protein